MQKVVVTGIGAVTALGPDVQSLAEGLSATRGGVIDCKLFDTTGFRTHLAAQAPDPRPRVDPLLLKNASRADAYGLQAATEAIKMAGLEGDALTDAALIFGTGTGGAAITEVYYRDWHARGTPDPALLVPHQPASVTDLVARHFRLRGPRTTIMTACSSSATAIGYAADRIRLGHVRVAIAGGAEGLCRLTYAGFNCLRATSIEPCQPFDLERKGLTLGEGAGVLVLEALEHAQARGAPILACLAGYGLTADAYHMTAPHPEGDGAARAMRSALADAKLSADEVEYINAHGTGTPHNDAAESAAIMSVFGKRAAQVAVSSIKSMVGHTLGAAGAIEAVASVVSLRDGFLPATLNLENPDPKFEIDFIRGQARQHRPKVMLSSSFAFGGNNTVLAFTAPL